MWCRFIAWSELGKTKNGCWWLACQACQNILETKTADSVSDKQLWHDNCGIEGMDNYLFFVG